MITRKSISDMDDNENNKKHSIFILSPDTSEKGNDGDAMCKKLKSNVPNIQVDILSDNTNDVTTKEKHATTENEWNDVAKCHNTWLALKSCTGTCQYFKPTKSQICLVLMQGHSVEIAFKAGGDHDKQCGSCIGNISPCFYKDAINVLTKAAHKHHEKYSYLKNVQLQKFMYNEYFNREYTYLYKN